MDREIGEEMVKVCQKLIKMLELASKAFRMPTEKAIMEVEKVRKEARKYSSELTRVLVNKGSTSEQGREGMKPYLSMVSSFDRMGYNIDGILDRLKKMAEEQILFTDRGIKEINDTFQDTLRLLENLPDLILTQNKLLAQQLREKGKSIFEMMNRYSEEHEQRLVEGFCVPKASPIYLAFLESLKGIVAHTLEISGKIVFLSAKA